MTTSVNKTAVPVIGAPNSFTAIDESFVTTEIFDDSRLRAQQEDELLEYQRQQQWERDQLIQKQDLQLEQLQKDQLYQLQLQQQQQQDELLKWRDEQERQRQSMITEIQHQPSQPIVATTTYMPVKTAVFEVPMQYDKEKAKFSDNTDHYTIEKEKIETYSRNPQPQAEEYSPGYFQRALDALRGRRNSESYSAHTSRTKDDLQHTIFGDSVHSKSLGIVSAREVASTQGSRDPAANLEKHRALPGHPGTSHDYRTDDVAPYNIYKSDHPSVVGGKGEVHSESITADLGRGYHHAVDSMKHALGLDKKQERVVGTGATTNVNPIGRSVVVDSALPSFDQSAPNSNALYSRMDNPTTYQQEQRAREEGSLLSNDTDMEFPLLI